MSQLALTFEPVAAPPRRRRAAALEHFHPGHETTAEALAGEERARDQEAVILRYFRDMYDAVSLEAEAAICRDPSRSCTLDMRPARRTPSEVEAALFSRGCRWPLTSIRRALTNLSTETEEQPNPPLKKHPEDRRPSPRGGRECCWSLRT